MKKRVICTLLHKNYALSFPYQPLWKDQDTDFICFTEKEGVYSKIYKVQLISEEQNVEKLLQEQPELICPGYQEYLYIKENQIITKAPWLENAIVTINEVNNTNFLPTADKNGNYIYQKNLLRVGGAYEGRKLLLTIGVPVSNQVAVIERCMKGIQPILEALPSELLVVDTGSKDGTVEITKQYGARVIQHEWCDNMSLVRNLAINNAEGLWYMSIDDDEWFEDVSEIIDFFKNGLYLNYNAASYIQRNFRDSKRKDYSDHRTIRIAKITPELHFEGRIHDALVIEEKKEYPLDAAAWHTGFAFLDNMQMAIKKSQRNLSILCYDMEEYPLDMRYNYQVANEFALFDHKTSIVYFFRGISIMRELYSEPRQILMYRKYILELMMQFNILESEEFFEYAESLVEGANFGVLDAILIYYLYIRMSDKIGKSVQSILETDKVLKQLIEEYEKDPKLNKLQASTSYNPLENGYQLAEYHRCTLSAYIKDRQIEQAMIHLKKLELERCDRGNQIKVWKLIIESGNKELLDCAVSQFINKKKNAKDEMWNLVYLTIENSWDVRLLFSYLEEKEIKEYYLKLYRHYPQEIKKQVLKWKAPFTKNEQYLKDLVCKENLIYQAELRILGEKLKEKIENLINSGEKDIAGELLAEYEKICPYDKEIEIIRLKLK